MSKLLKGKILIVFIPALLSGCASGNSSSQAKIENLNRQLTYLNKRVSNLENKLACVDFKVAERSIQMVPENGSFPIPRNCRR